MFLFHFCLDTKVEQKIKAAEKQLKIFAFRYVEEAKDWDVFYLLFALMQKVTKKSRHQKNS